MEKEKICGKVVSVNISEKKGMRKTPVKSARAVVGHGFEEDAHAGDWHRQISLLAMESINEMVSKGLDVGPGDFAENITTEGIDLPSLPVGTLLNIGDVSLKISQIGKTCHSRCAIYYQAGDCVMPREGIFAEVLKEGPVSTGDWIKIE